MTVDDADNQHKAVVKIIISIYQIAFTYLRLDRQSYGVLLDAVRHAIDEEHDGRRADEDEDQHDYVDCVLKPGSRQGAIDVR